METLTGVEARTRHDYRRDIRNHLLPFFGDRDVCDSEAIGTDDIARWVNALEAGERDRKKPTQWVRKPVSPKTLANHGILYAIFQSAVEAQPQLRASNPCALTRLPRVDDGVEDEMVFLDREEYALVRNGERLLTHLGWICEQPRVADFELELRELMRAVKGVTRAEPRRVSLPVPCPSCDAYTLVREDHSGWAAECLLCTVNYPVMNDQACSSPCARRVAPSAVSAS